MPESSRDGSQWAAPVVLLTGYVAAFGAGKLPAVLPAIQADTGMTLFEASFLVSMFQVAAASIGVLAGTLADRVGHRRVTVCGIVVAIVGSLWGAASTDAAALLGSRALESLGFTLCVLPGPSLLRRTVAPERLSRWLGVWATYMPLGFACGLVAAPALATIAGWRGAWIGHAMLSLVSLLLLLLTVPPDRRLPGAPVSRFWPIVRATLGAPGPWMLAACFGAYAGQYLSVVSFLPTIYQQAGILPTSAGILTAGVAAINLLGNIGAGQLLHRGVGADRVLAAASVLMMLCGWLVFGSGLGFEARYLSVLIMSAVMGLIPGTLFVTAPRYAPGPQAVASTVGLMQQGSAVGQMLLPPLVAWAATMVGGWQYTWVVTGAFALLNLALALTITRWDARFAPAAAPTARSAG